MLTSFIREGGPCSFLFKAAQGAQKNYFAMELEVLAVYLGVQYFAHFLCSQVKTGHKTFKDIATFNSTQYITAWRKKFHPETT